MPTVSFPDNKRLLRTLRVLSGEREKSIASLVAEAVEEHFKPEIERITASPFFSENVPNLGHLTDNKDGDDGK